MTVTRQTLHEELDRALDSMGIGADIPSAYRTIGLEYVVQDGKPHMAVRERETVRPLPIKGTVKT